MDDLTAPARRESAGPPARRAVFRAAGAIGAAVAVGASVTACGADGSGGATAGAAGDPGRGIPASEIPVGGGAIFAADHVVITQPTRGTYKAFDSTCPHAGCAVSMVTEEGIICPCHGSVFDRTTGERVSGPAPTGLAPRSIHVTGGTLTVA